MTITATPGSATADSYVTVAEADAYFTARNVTTWTGADTVKEPALRKATAYLDNQYRLRWVGVRSVEAQALAWPRRDGYRGWGYPLLDADGFDIAVDGVPQQVKNACAEAALLALTGVTLEPRLERGGQIKSIGKSVGPLRKDITYADGASIMDRITSIEGILRGLVKSTPGSTSSTVSVVRA